MKHTFKWVLMAHPMLPAFFYNDTQLFLNALSPIRPYKNESFHINCFCCTAAGSASVHRSGTPFPAPRGIRGTPVSKKTKETATLPPGRYTAVYTTPQKAQSNR